jgi:hypothetical protein
MHHTHFSNCLLNSSQLAAIKQTIAITSGVVRDEHKLINLPTPRTKFSCISNLILQSHSTFRTNALVIFLPLTTPIYFTGNETKIKSSSQRM